MRFGFVGPSYSATSTAVADEECINLYAETVESASAVSAAKVYGGSSAQGLRNYFWTPGIAIFATLPLSPVRGQCEINGRAFAVAGAKLYEVFSDGTHAERGTVANDGGAVSITASNIQLLISSGGSAYCYTLATNVLTDVTASLAGTPGRTQYADGYFITHATGTNKFQLSGILDGTTWPGLQVNAVSVFPENIVSIIVNHRELWVFGSEHTQPYQDTGSDNIFDVIPGTLIEKGCVSQNAPCLLDNSVFWVDQDARGARAAWRSNGYSPQRISTHAVEIDLQSYSLSQISQLTSYSYQDGGHLFWVLYVPGSSWSWVYDVGEGMWHKRDKFINSVSSAHWGWNHIYAFGKHLIGDWSSGHIYELSQNYVDDNGSLIRRLRRAPTIIDEMRWIPHPQLSLDIQTGLGPQPPLLDGAGKPRAPQVNLRWSDDRGKTWSNIHTKDCGKAGEYRARVIFRRLGRSRYRVYEMSMTDPVKWTIVDAYLGVTA